MNKHTAIRNQVHVCILLVICYSCRRMYEWHCLIYIYISFYNWKTTARDLSKFSKVQYFPVWVEETNFFLYIMIISLEIQLNFKKIVFGIGTYHKGKKEQDRLKSIISWGDYNKNFLSYCFICIRKMNRFYYDTTLLKIFHCGTCVTFFHLLRHNPWVTSSWKPFLN